MSTKNTNNISKNIYIRNNRIRTKLLLFIDNEAQSKVKQNNNNLKYNYGDETQIKINFVEAFTHNKTKKYVKMVMGLYILFSIIEPFIENSNELKVNVEDLYNQYSVETSAESENVNQNSMDSRLDELYKQKLENDIEIPNLFSNQKNLLLLFC